MRAWSCALAWAVLVAAGRAEETPSLPTEEDAAALESAASEPAGAGVLAGRWRMQGWPQDPRQARVYQRLEWHPDERREAYLLLEKDPGEPHLSDFAAFYGRWQDRRRPIELVLGDLRPGWGQGLVLGRGASGRGLALPEAGHDSRALGYRGSDENQAVRGAALRLGRAALEAVLVAGQARRDGRTDPAGQVVSLPVSGLHTTAREVQGHGLLAVRVAAGRLRGRVGPLSAGVSGLALDFDRRLALHRAGQDRPLFAGRSQRVAAADLRLDGGAAQAWAEAAWQAPGGGGLVAGGRCRLGGVRLGVAVRRCGPGYHSFLGATGSSGSTQNEQGWLLVAERRPRPWGWRGFIDRSRPVRPAGPTEQVWGAQGEGPLAVAVRARVSWREDRQIGAAERRSRPPPEQRLRLDLERPGEAGGLVLRLEGRRAADAGGRARRGGLAAVVWRGPCGAGRVALHLSRFHTTAWAARLYEYEYELPGTSAIRPLAGDGWRGYGVVTRPWGPVLGSVRWRWQRVAGRPDQHQLGLQLDVARGTAR